MALAAATVITVTVVFAVVVSSSRSGGSVEPRLSLGEQKRVEAAQNSASLSTVNTRRAAAEEKIAASSDGPSEALAPPEAGDDAPIAFETSDPVVKDPGTRTQTPQGELLTSRTVQVRAVSTSEGRATTLIWNIELTMFRPGEDPPPGQTTGVYYLQGSWTLTPLEESGRAAVVTRGTLAGAFDFDPLESGRDIALSIDVIGPQVVGDRAARKGRYTGSPEFTGTLVLPEGHGLGKTAFATTGEGR